MGNGRFLRGLPVAGADFEGYQLAFPALNKVAISILSSPLVFANTYRSSLQSQTVEDVPKPSFATT